MSNPSSQSSKRTDASFSTTIYNLRNRGTGNLGKRGVLEDIRPNTKRSFRSQKAETKDATQTSEASLSFRKWETPWETPLVEVVATDTSSERQQHQENVVPNELEDYSIGSFEAAEIEEQVEEIHTQPFIDIDENDHNDPLAAAEYIEEIYEYLKQTEKNFRPIHYMEYHPEISENMRCILVDWLVEVSEEFKLSTQTLFLTVAYVDLYLSKKQVPKKRLQLVGLTCLHIAGKYEMIYPPRIDQLVYTCDSTYSATEICTMEQFVLQVLDFRLTIPTAAEFLKRSLKATQTQGEKRLEEIATFLIELALCGYHFLSYPPSLIAAAATCLALYETNRVCWTATLEHYTGYSTEDAEFRNCTNELYYFQVNMPRHTSIKALRDKWSRRLGHFIVPSNPPFAEI